MYILYVHVRQPLACTKCATGLQLVCLWVDDAEAKVLPGQGLGELLVVLAHELHELAIHPQDDKHLELLVGEERIAIR